MKESTLWGHLKPELKRHGKFQKVSDRFTPGVPDVLGCCEGRGFALELKEFSGVRVLRVSFRPGQLDWLRDWSLSGGHSFIISTSGNTVSVFPHSEGPHLESGVTPGEAFELSTITFTKTFHNTWHDFVNLLIHLP